MKKLKVVLPVGVLALGIAGAWILVNARTEPETRIPEVPVPLVRVQTVRLVDVAVIVESQGTVSPRTESTLVPEVAGRVVWVSPSFVSGGFFEKDEPLLRIEPYDYREAIVQARASVARSELRLAQENAEAAVARREWDDLGDGEATALTLREPQVADAAAALEAARAALERAARNLDRTEVRGPYVGRVRSKHVDVGQYVAPGTPLATVYSVDVAEIRLPLPDADLAFVDLPLGYRDSRARGKGTAVTIQAEFAGKTFEWEGHIVRTEGEIDPRTRVVHAVVQVDDPYRRGSDRDRPPLAAGMFVRARIVGRPAQGVAVIPRAAVRSDGRVLVVDEQDRLRFRSVDLLRETDETAIVRSGLEEGERVCISPLVAVTDGMRVRPREAT